MFEQKVGNKEQRASKIHRRNDGSFQTKEMTSNKSDQRGGVTKEEKSGREEEREGEEEGREEGEESELGESDFFEVSVVPFVSGRLGFCSFIRSSCSCIARRRLSISASLFS